MVGGIPGQSRDAVLTMAYRVLWWVTSQDSPGMPYLLWRTGILCHRVSYGGGHPRTVQGCRTYYGVQGYSAIECPVVGDIPGQSRDAVLTMAYRDTLP